MRKNKKYLFILVFVILAVFLSINNFTFSKYIYNSVWDYFLRTKGFYFNSDNLGMSSIDNVNNLWDGESVHFNLKNNLNDNVITDYDIYYIITCSIIGETADYVECDLNESGFNSINGTLLNSKSCKNKTSDEIDVTEYTKEDCELNNYEWSSDITTNDIFFDVVLTDPEYEINDVIVSINATSNSPYQKTISGNFTLHKSIINENEISLNYDSFSNHDELTITNSYSESKCIELTWDSEKLRIDADENDFNSYLTDLNGYINEIKFVLGAKKSLKYRFYQTNFEEVLDVSEFTVQESTGC